MTRDLAAARPPRATVGRLPLRRRLQPRRRRDHDHRDRRQGRRGQPGVLRDVRPRPRGVRRHPTSTCSPASTTSPAPSRRCAACSTASATRSRLERTYLHRDGSPVRVQASLSLVRGPAGEPRYVICLVEDVTERFRLAVPPALPRRPRPAHRPRHPRACSPSGSQLALDEPGRRPVGRLRLDLDGFSGVNDTLGHDIGDALLRPSARRLTAATSARTGTSWPAMGGDEFVVLAVDVDAVGAARARGPGAGGRRAAVRARRAPRRRDGDRRHRAAATASACRRGRADAGRRHHAVLGEGGTAAAAWPMFEPRTATAARQPVRARRPHGRRAGRGRVRPRVPAAGPAGRRRDRRRRGAGPLEPARPGSGSAPTVFVPLAEETGHIVPLGRWVLTQACRQATAWSAGRDPADPLLLSA